MMTIVAPTGPWYDLTHESVLRNTTALASSTPHVPQYMADIFPETELWPTCAPARAIARSAAAEMHSSFSALRSNMPMNTRRSAPGEGNWNAADVDKDIRRVCEVWDECRAEAERRGLLDGPFLFGSFTAVDAMFAPGTYNKRLEAHTRNCSCVMDHLFLTCAVDRES